MTGAAVLKARPNTTDIHSGRQAGCPGAQALRGYLADEGPAELSDSEVLAPSVNARKNQFGGV